MSAFRHPKRWKVSDPIVASVAESLAEYPPFFRQILFARGIQTEMEARAYLNGDSEQGDPYQLSGMEAAVDRISYAIDHNEAVAVYGDYDVDGVTATALMTQVLKSYGAETLYYIPDRFDEGYGLNMDALDFLAARGVKLVITVDCGIRSPREADHARELGMDLIISDHHHPGEETPDAVAVICPKQPGDVYPDKNMAGVGLAYKIAQALEQRRPLDGVIAENWIDLVAIGTIADVVPLKGENRQLVRRGLQRARLGGRIGLTSLVNVAGLVLSKINAGDIAFGVAPRLNAGGRLDTPMDSLHLLMTDDLMQAGRLAQKLDNQNRQRQELTQSIQTEAARQVDESGVNEILCAFSPEFKPGIIGLAASRLVDTHYRPAIVGFEDVKDNVTRASCRSIPEFHITRALDTCEDILIQHGGHALAAGFTIENRHRPELIRRLRESAAEQFRDLDLRPEVRIDHEIPLSELRPEFLRYLDMLQPTGQENSEAVFVSRNLRITKASTVGAEGKHLRLSVTDGRIVYDGIAFRQGDRKTTLPERIDIAYVFERNEYNGKVSLQLNVRDFKETGLPD